MVALIDVYFFVDEQFDSFGLGHLKESAREKDDVSVGVWVVVLDVEFGM
tara:strand:+ start:1021 stop:1167 length:147 start_codon:yes stop_codon:yes gene_type:complete